MLNYKYLGLKIIVSDSAMRELIKYERLIQDVINILENGYDTPRKRKEGTIERWYDKGKKTFNVVIVKSYNISMKEECWILIHFGKFTRK